MPTDDLRERIDRWRRLAECDALAGAPLGDALNEACDEIERLKAELTLHVRCRRDISIGEALRLTPNPGDGPQ
jgi:hypothetical protein